MRSQVEAVIDTSTSPGRDALGYDVLDGLTRPFKELPPKYFYDAYGRELCGRIDELPEYYPTRTERRILGVFAPDVARISRAAEVVELGARDATRAPALLDALMKLGSLRSYLPVDSSVAAVDACVAEISERFPPLSVYGLVADFELALDAVPEHNAPQLILLLGGAVGRLLPGSRRRLLRQIGRRLGDDGFLLLGTDVVKDPSVLRCAYDDAAGITAEFNLNVLRVLNRELGADFDLGAFEHVALYDEEREWVEMRLRSRSEQLVEIPALGLQVSFAEGEEMRTEISAKFTEDRLIEELVAADLRPLAVFADPDEWFTVSLSCPFSRTEDDRENQPL